MSESVVDVQSVEEDFVVDGDGFMVVLAAIIAVTIKTKIAVDIIVGNGNIVAIHVGINIGIILVKGCRIPWFVRTKNDVMKVEEFIVGGRTEWEIGKAVLETERKNIPVESSDREFSSKCHGTVVDLGAEGLKLDTGMNGLAFTMPCVLVHDEADRAVLGVSDTGDGADRAVVDGMITDTDNVHRTVGGFEETNVGAAKAAISTAIN